ncbi:MAG: hypothetical protein KZQ84_15460 [Candidatus Thiodiazotropha sp. (ex Lucinoma borealis)]|nr:hypothetical protein [Candidatus Thiodiazotropha sp. (ex Lucinoma borealis)]
MSSFEVLACPDIVGTWRSSKELSIEYNTKLLELEPHTIKFMNDVYGILTITYTKTSIRMHEAPTKKISIKGKEHDFVFEEMSSSYEQVSCTEESVTILSNSPYSTGEETMTFVDLNTFWVSTMPGSDKREYFKRVPKDI